MPRRLRNVSFAVAEVLEQLAWTRLLRTPPLPRYARENVAGDVEAFPRRLVDEALDAFVV